MTVQVAKKKIMKIENIPLSLSGCGQANDLWEGSLLALDDEGGGGQRKRGWLTAHLLPTSQLPALGMGIDRRVRALPT